MNARLPEVDATNYVWAHGHAPRGRGSWAFSTKRNPGMAEMDDAKVTLWVHQSTYGAAKATARKHFAGHSVIFPLT